MRTAAGRNAGPSHTLPRSAVLHEIATQLRIDSVQATTAAGSGHPTSCASAAEIMAVLFFGVMRYDVQEQRAPRNDVFVLSKGHAAPILYAAWAEAGAFPREHLLTLRQLNSDLEGHPTPRLPFVDVATGSLGQGLSAGIGLALDARLLGVDRRTYVLMGDGESAEGSVWEAAELGARYGLGSLCATIDINRLARASRRCSSTKWTYTRRDGNRLAGRRSWSTATTSTHWLPRIRRRRTRTTGRRSCSRARRRGKDFHDSKERRASTASR